MLTRLKVSGFKNFLNLDVRFGAFTCIFGQNGIGKSNLFDAIHFLSLLADRPLMDAAAAVRASGRKARDIHGLFYRSDEYRSPQIDFEIEVLVAQNAEDDFGQLASATITTLRYKLSIGSREASAGGADEQLVILKEELSHIPRRESKATLTFPHTKHWYESVVTGERRAPFFISTDSASRTVKIHQDGGSRGQPLSYQLGNLKRTVLAASNSAESPTIVVLRREMQSWLQLQLEPSSLRQADEFSDSPYLTASGLHVPATLDRLSRMANGSHNPCAELASRLSELVGGVRTIYADRDLARELISAYVTFADNVPHPANSLSDGTLRFLALALLERDPEFRGLLCLEEPENGINPERIPAMMNLLEDLAMDVEAPIGLDNPLRQVIVNTHSPTFTAEAPEDSVLLAESVRVEYLGKLLPTIQLTPLEKTWRAQPGGNSIKKGALIRYLRPVARTRPGRVRVADREEAQLEMDFVQ